jgi:hypothetical protein
MLKLTHFSMSKMVEPNFQPFLTPLLIIGPKKHHFGYVMDFEKLWIFTTHNKQYIMSQKCENNFWFNYKFTKSKTHFLTWPWPRNYWDCKVHLSLIINVFGVIISKLKREMSKSNLFKFICWNFQLAYGFYTTICDQSKKNYICDVQKNSL